MDKNESLSLVMEFDANTAKTRELALRVATPHVQHVKPEDVTLLKSPRTSARAAELKKLRMVFNSLDVDGNQTLDKAEFKTVIARMGGIMSAEAVEEAIAELDSDCSGTLSFDEFEVWWQKNHPEVLAQLARLKELKDNLITPIAPLDEDVSAADDGPKDMQRVVNWTLKPNVDLAKEHRLLQQPLFVDIPDGDHDGAPSRLPFDPTNSVPHHTLEKNPTYKSAGTRIKVDSGFMRLPYKETDQGAPIKIKNSKCCSNWCPDTQTLRVPMTSRWVNVYDSDMTLEAFKQGIAYDPDGSKYKSMTKEAFKRQVANVPDGSKYESVKVVCNDKELTLNHIKLSAQGVKTGQDVFCSNLDKYKLEVNGGLYPLRDTSIENMGQIGGPGMRIYFALLDGLWRMFLIMSIISLPAVVLFFNGPNAKMYANPNAAEFSNAALINFTIGNIVATAESLEDGSTLELWVAVTTDFINTLFFMFVIILIDRRVKQLVEATDYAMISMSDYSVYITPWAEGFKREMPWGDGENEFGGKDKHAKFRDHLHKWLEHTIRRPDGTGVRVAMIPDDSAENGGKVPAIWPVYDEDENIKQWRKKVDALLQFENAIAAAIARKNEGGIEIEDALRPMEKCVKKLEDIESILQEHRKNIGFRAIGAFVTFDVDDDHDIAQEWAKLQERNVDVLPDDDYGDEEDPVVTSSHQFHFQGRCVKVVEAPEPETIQWDHLEYDEMKRGTRRRLVYFSVLMMLVFGVAGLLFAASQKIGLTWEVTCDDMLRSNSSGTAFCDGLNLTGVGESNAEQWYRTGFTQATDSLISYRVYDDSSGGCQYSNKTACCSEGVTSIQDAQRLQCHRWDKNGTYWIDRSREAMCYSCRCSKATTGTVTDAYCEPYHTKKSSIAVWKLVSLVITVIVNQILKFMLEYIVVHEKTHTTADEQGSMAIKVFLAQLLNTGILILILTAETDVPLLKSIPGEKYTSVTPEWYAKILSPLTQTMLIQLVTPPSMHFVTEQVQTRVRNFLVWSGLLHAQNSLNSIYEDPPMKLASSYGEVLLGVSVTLMYCSAMPHMLWVASFGFYVKFWGDKFGVLRVYRKPPLYGHSLFNNLGNVLFIVLTTHCLLATYFYACAGGIQPATPQRTLKTSFSRPHVLPMLCLSMICVFVLVARVLWKTFSQYTKAGQQCVEAREEVRKMRQKMAKIAGGALDGGDLEERQRSERAKEDHAHGGLGDVIPTFTEALLSSQIVNKDDDYHMDQHEDLRELESSFKNRIRTSFLTNRFPFAEKNETQKQFAERAFEAVKSQYEDADDFLVDSSDVTKASKVTKYRCIRSAKVRAGRRIDSEAVGLVRTGTVIDVHREYKFEEAQYNLHRLCFRYSLNGHVSNGWVTLAKHSKSNTNTSDLEKVDRCYFVEA